jgi:pyrophosphatase PpaX
MTRSRFDAVLFDLDGTLLDSIELILASYHHTIARHGLLPQTDADILAGLGTPLDAQLGRWTDDLAAIPAMIETYRAHNFEVHDAMVRAYPGVTEVVLALREAGTKLAVVTSKRRDGTRRGLAALGLSDAFDVLVCADDVERAKPHPEPVWRALDALDVPRERAVFVGDSTHDMASGRAAGVHTVGVLWGPFRREALVPHEPGALVEDADQLHRALFRR